MKYIVKSIIEPDFGCEDRDDDYVATDTVLLRDEEGTEIEIKIPAKELLSKDISEGDWVYFDVNNVIFKDWTNNNSHWGL